MSEFLTREEVKKHLRYYVKTYFMSDTMIREFEKFITTTPDDFNVDRYADVHEKETDAFILKVVGAFDLSQEAAFSIVDSEKPDVHRTFLIRLQTIENYLEQNPSRAFPTFGDEKQLIVNCLITFWQNFRRPGLVNFFE